MPFVIPGVNDLETLSPDIAKEAEGWDPKEYGSRSSKKMLWKCKKGHLFNTTIEKRTNRGQGCPYCSNKKLLEGFNDLKTKFPEIAKEADGWDPSVVLCGTAQKKSWKCTKGHQWEQKVSSRIFSNSQCPFCTNRRVWKGFNDTESLYPEVAKEALGWDPSEFLYGSHTKMPWKCKRGHTWKAEIRHRTIKGHGCQVCALKFRERVVDPQSTLQYLSPDIAKQWHKTKNGSLSPNDVANNSGVKVWWQCPKSNEHHWEAAVGRRTKGSGCPFCDGKKVSSDNCLSTLSPDIAKQWHPTKNGNLTPNDVTNGSRKKAWWQCPKSKEHQWEAIIERRTRRGDQCPFCSNKSLCSDNSLATLSPEIAKQWHPTKNGNLTPNDFLNGSVEKVWWQCAKSVEHQWEATISSRTSKSPGCPFCKGKRVCSENSLATLSPKIAGQWHPTKNGNLTPNDVMNGSAKKVWWQCPENKEHTYEMIVSDKTGAHKCECPFCSGKRVCVENCLATISPEIAKQWHPTKNGNLTPHEVTNRSSSRKFWWQCSKFKKHEWQALVATRTGGSGCPFCSNQSSIPEIRILAELEAIFKNVISRKRIKGNEVDIFLEDLQIGIEYDGSFYHADKEKKDQSKNNLLSKENVTLIRVRENPLERISSKDILIKQNNLQKQDINQILLVIKNKTNDISSYTKIDIEEYIKRQDFINNKSFKKYKKCLPSPIPQKTLAANFPDVAKEWHKAKNDPLLPTDFPPKSSYKAWWQCPKVKDHIYEAVIGNRTGNKSTCPFCAGRKPSKEKSIATLSPELINEWHPTKNRDITPEHLTAGSSEKVWWQCSKNHEWNQAVYDRTRKDGKAIGCPYCSRKRFHPDHSLTTLSPEIAKQWHPIKNQGLTPESISNFSGKKVWWQCTKFKDHEYQASIGNRTVNKSSCPFCAGRKACKQNSLSALSPKVAEQWHPTKNGSLTPNDVTNGSSSKKHWWRCSKGHEWDATVASRTRKSNNKNPTGCPFCSGNRVCSDNSLFTISPDIAKQWHPTKNGSLTPNDVTNGSTKKVWWQCQNVKEHSWEATIGSRTMKGRKKGAGCPHCYFGRGSKNSKRKR